jgi:phosphoribosylformimino-5-aminoimidazole carboxamide ribotide isomerase
MLLVIPSIDLVSGICRDCICSTLPMVKDYSGLSKHPDQLSQLFRRENAKSLHINDIDSLENRENKNNIDTIIKIKNAVEIPIQCYSKFHNINDCKFLLDNGIHRIILDDLLLEEEKAMKELISSYTSSRIAFYAEVNSQHKANKCNNLAITITEYISKIKAAGGDRLVLKDTSAYDSLDKSIETLNELAKNNTIKITLQDAACNYYSLNYINEKSNFLIDSIILGKALYENKFPCQEIWRLAESRLEK